MWGMHRRRLAFGVCRDGALQHKSARKIAERGLANPPCSAPNRRPREVRACARATFHPHCPAARVSSGEGTATVMSFIGRAKLRILAGQAKPSPAIGQALGPLGLNMMEFCKAFNAATQQYNTDVPIPVELVAFSNRTFKFNTKTPPTTWLLKRVAAVRQGARKPGLEWVGEVSVKEVYEIANLKSQDNALRTQSLERIAKQVVATAGSMGLRVVHEVRPPKKDDDDE